MFRVFSFANFRGFQDLNLVGLGRVNLIVGRNDSGKTSLLEGVAMLTSPRLVIQQLPTLLRPQGRGDVGKRYFRWLIRDESTTSHAEIHGEWKGTDRGVIFQRQANPPVPLQPPNQYESIWSGGEMQVLVLKGQQDLPFRVVSAKPTTVEELVALYSRAVEMRAGEDKMNSLFTSLDGRIQKVRVTSAPDGIQLMFDFGLNEMLPVSQVGQGIHRLIAIYSELIAGNARVCAIDEIENGIHHSMLQKVWTGIGTAAEQLDVQVFATTHSYECIEAAYRSFADRSSSGFAVIQLFRVSEAVKSRVLNQEEIKLALEGGIDLR